MFKRCFSLVAGIAVSFAMPAHSLSLEEAVTLAVERAPELQVDEARIAEQSVAISIEKDGWLPALKGTSEIGTSNNIRNELRLSQTVYDWGKTRAKVNREESSKQQLVYSAKTNREVLVLEIVELYLDWLGANARMTASDDEVSRLKNLVALTRRRVGTVVDRVELTRAETALARARERRVIAQGDFLEALGSLEQRIGRRLIERDIKRFPNWQRWFSAIPHHQLQDWVKAAPAIKSAKASVNTAEAKLEVSKTERIPSLSLEFVAERVEDSFGHRTDNRVALRVETPLFQGLSSWRRPRSAEMAVSAAKFEQEQLEQRMLRELKSSLTLIRVLGDRVPAIQAQLEASEVTLDLYLKQFLVGRREIADLIGAENERMDALISKIEVEVEQARLGAVIASELGQLEDRLLGRLPVAKPEGA